MTIKKIVGWTILTIPFVVSFIFIVQISSVEVALLAYLLGFTFVVGICVGAYLIVD